MSSYLLSSPQDVCSDCDHFFRIGVPVQSELKDAAAFPLDLLQQNHPIHAGRKQDYNSVLEGNATFTTALCSSIKAKSGTFAKHEITCTR
jgi:hypothetical protein